MSGESFSITRISYFHFGKRQRPPRATVHLFNQYRFQWTTSQTITQKPQSFTRTMPQPKRAFSPPISPLTNTTALRIERLSMRPPSFYTQAFVDLTLTNSGRLSLPKMRHRILRMQSRQPPRFGKNTSQRTARLRVAQSQASYPALTCSCRVFFRITHHVMSLRDLSRYVPLFLLHLLALIRIGR